MTRQVVPFGRWPSPLSARMAAETVIFSDIQWDAASETLVWLERRGRQGVLVAQQGADGPYDLTRDLSVSGGVGYGGGAFTVAGGVVIFAAGGRLYRQALRGGGPRAITPAFGQAASPALSPDGRWLVYVHSDGGQDGLAVVDSQGQSWPAKLAYGTDFIMQPAWHPAGDRLACVVWDHPQMPWDSSELVLLELEATAGQPRVRARTVLAGGPDVSLSQPEFSPDGRWLAYLSDESGWPHLLLHELATGERRALTDGQLDYGAPAWVQGTRTFAWTGDSRALVATANVAGFKRLVMIDIAGGAQRPIEGLDAYTDLAQVAVSANGRAAVIASAPNQPPRVVSVWLAESAPPPALVLDPGPTPSIQVLVDDRPAAIIHRRAGAEIVPPSALATAEPLAWPGHDGETVYGLYMAPSSETVSCPGAPPLIVFVHGGPTSQVTASYYGNGLYQFFATRGYATLAVNYRGSTGYGRAYLRALRGQWGVLDVEDCASGAAYLVSRGLADPRRLVIHGGSAGGYTVLQSLVCKPGFYRAGVSLYGISNLFTAATETHKFEERYMDGLLGALPEAEAIYRARSPLFHAERIADPLLLFQGADDEVVRRDQSDAIVAALTRRRVPHAYHVYEGEGHGFRKPETIQHVLETTQAFLKEHVLFA